MKDIARYKARITTWQLGESKTGTPQLVFTVELGEKISGPADDDMGGLTRSIFMSLTAGTADFVVRDLRALGYDQDTLDAIDPSHPRAFDFADKDVVVGMHKDSYDGKEREKWEFRLGGIPTVKPLARGGMAQLNSIMSGALKSARPAASGRSSSGSSASPPPTGDDGNTIPF